VGDGDGIFNGPSHAVVVVFGVNYVGPMPCEVCVITARKEDCVFMIVGVIGFGV
jgi:hypothetical protein